MYIIVEHAQPLRCRARCLRRAKPLPEHQQLLPRRVCRSSVLCAQPGPHARSSHLTTATGALMRAMYSTDASERFHVQVPVGRPRQQVACRIRSLTYVSDEWLNPYDRSSPFSPTRRLELCEFPLVS